jgi:hypothetical protein
MWPQKTPFEAVSPDPCKAIHKKIAAVLACNALVVLADAEQHSREGIAASAADNSGA